MRVYSTDLKERVVRAMADGLPMREAARRFNVAVTTVKRAVLQQRETGSLEHGAQRDPPQFVCVDERSTHTALARLYGWAPHDRRARTPVPRHPGHHSTAVAALTPDGLREPWLIEGRRRWRRRPAPGTSRSSWGRGCSRGRWWCWTT